MFSKNSLLIQTIMIVGAMSFAHAGELVKAKSEAPQDLERQRNAAAIDIQKVWRAYKFRNLLQAEAAELGTISALFDSFPSLQRKISGVSSSDPCLNVADSVGLSAHSTIFDLDKIPEDIEHRKIFFSDLEKAIEKAWESSKAESEAAYEYFDKRDLDSVLVHSKNEIEMYPVIKYKEIKFRTKFIRSPYILAGEYNRHDLISKLDDFKGEKDFLTFFKVVRKSQVCAIKSSGLNSKYGGVGGLSETAGMVTTARDDRGQMFMGSVEDKSGIFSRYYGQDSITLLIRIPIEETLRFNLTMSSLPHEWTTIGIIPSSRLFIMNPDGSESGPLSDLDCHGA